MSKDKYAIYQVRDSAEMRCFLFEPLDRLKETGLPVECGNYKHVDTGTLEKGNDPLMKILNDIFGKFNIDRPADFKSRSMSVSDVVVLRFEGTLVAYYVDMCGFTETPEFLAGRYKYYFTKRPIDINTFPKFADEPVRVENYDNRKPVDGTVRSYR